MDDVRLHVRAVSCHGRPSIHKSSSGTCCSTDCSITTDFPPNSLQTPHTSADVLSVENMDTQSEYGSEDMGFTPPSSPFVEMDDQLETNALQHNALSFSFGSSVGSPAIAISAVSRLYN